MGRGATIEAARLAKARLVEMLAGVTGGTGVASRGSMMATA
jgi:hypothetical protein